MAGTSKPNPTSHGLSKRLLFVDDEEGIRSTLPTILERRGFDVRVAATVPEALSEIRTHEFDVLLSDLNTGDAKGPSQMRGHSVDWVSRL